MAELPDSGPLENVRNPCPEHSKLGRNPVEDDAGLGVTSPSEAQVSLLLAGDSSPAPARLSVTSRNIVFEVTGKRFTRVELLLLDLLGALVLPKDDGSCALQLHTFAYSKMTRRGLVPAPGRTHEVFTVFFTHQGEAPADSRATAEQWKASLLQRCSQRCRDIFLHEHPLHQRQQAEGGTASQLRHYLVLVNPISGKGQAEPTFRNRVQPLLDIAEITCDVVVTKQAGHARELVREYDVFSIDGIVISSGDGLLYEVVNGLMEREDRRSVISIPIGILPTGSGNALCASTLHESREECNLENAVFQIIRGGIAPMDLALAHTSSGPSYFNLLMGWGLVADVDIESEKWRAIGGLRFALGGVISLAKKKVYRGRLWYLPVEEGKAAVIGEEGRACRGGQTAERNVVMRTESAQQPQENVPCSGEAEGRTETIVTGSSPQQNGEGQEAQVPVDASPQEGDLSGRRDQPRVEGGTRMSPLMKLEPVHLPDPSEPPPSAWTYVEGEFVAIVASLTSHMAHKMMSTPHAELGSGVFHIVCIPAEVSRFELLSIMTSKLEIGEHVDHPKLRCLRAKAFRFEPVTSPGHLTLDGETIDYATIQAEAFRGACRVMCRKQRPLP